MKAVHQHHSSAFTRRGYHPRRVHKGVPGDALLAAAACRLRRSSSDSTNAGGRGGAAGPPYAPGGAAGACAGGGAQWCGGAGGGGPPQVGANVDAPGLKLNVGADGLSRSMPGRCGCGAPACPSVPSSQLSIAALCVALSRTQDGSRLAGS